MNPLSLPRTRRETLAQLSILLGGATVAAHAQQPSMQQAPSSSANRSRTSLHQEIDYAVSPARIIEILLDSKQFAAFTGMSAQIDPTPGGAFKLFSGLVEGRTIEVVPAQRIVQAWRPASWGSGVYSVVRFELNGSGARTTVALDHSGFAEGLYDHLYEGWNQHYWDPLRKYLG
ncbi:MAG TPA: SRPBCC domain-containing protein [Terracidiphilus sp.]|nr:SRPBCC domain-containing protein [Terracidiphilus sp.]